MEGPNDGYRPESSGKRAGESNGQDIRDWQKNTWFGPAPQNSNPFDEPEDAPELKESRSENVTEHVGEFWNAPGTGYQNTAPTRAIPEGNGRAKNEKKKKYPQALRLIIGMVLFLAVVFIVLRFAVFSVKQIVVTGNNTIPAEEIEACRRICEDEIGAVYRVREYIED